jgi:hypothetical protein
MFEITPLSLVGAAVGFLYGIVCAAHAKDLIDIGEKVHRWILAGTSFILLSVASYGFPVQRRVYTNLDGQRRLVGTMTVQSRPAGFVHGYVFPMGFECARAAAAFAVAYAVTYGTIHAIQSISVKSATAGS